ncbi:MAG: TetR family transcriptional regulator [Proteobacteria bacterium]|nr:TetR family transcriptional regulator [Pseudomonadota bacterium]
MNLSVQAEKVLPASRKASKEVRRQQLIEATIETLARKGYAQLTLTDVAVTAGVSHGLVNFHFQSKEKLFAETLLHLAAEYQANWQAYLATAGTAPALQLDALLRADLDPKVCAPVKVICWAAFWGESQSRPIYQQEYGANDEAYSAMLAEICERLTAAGGYALDGHMASRVFRAIGDGVWQDIAFSARPYSLDEARKTMYAGAAALFPKHFTATGLR